jgi:succinyl-CoA synthetase beta subunit
LTRHAENNLVTQIKKVVPSLPKDYNVRAFRQVEVNPLLFELHQAAIVKNPAASGGALRAGGHYADIARFASTCP